MYDDVFFVFDQKSVVVNEYDKKNCPLFTQLTEIMAVVYRFISFGVDEGDVLFERNGDFVTGFEAYCSRIVLRFY